MITISRDSGYADKLRNYKVLLDGKLVGVIGNGETKTFEVEHGEHTLMLKIDWAKSNILNFVQNEGENITFVASSPLRGLNIFKAIIYISLLSNRYINLKQLP